MKPGSGYVVVDNKLLILVAIVLVFNTVLAGLSLNFIYIQHMDKKSGCASRQLMIGDMVEYNKRLAQNLGVQDRASVKEKLASFSYELDLAKDGDELASLLFTHGRQVQETILKEWDALLREKILALIDRDPNLRKQPGKTQFTLRVSPVEGVTADPTVLHKDSLKKITDVYLAGGLAQEMIFRIEVADGHSRMLVPYDPLHYIQTLNEELDSLRVSMHELRVAAGLAEMSGPGVVIRLYDSQEGYQAGDLIHDTDVRDVANELFAAGAKGMAVGGQRLIATSPIRCVGPVIRVNQKEIPANPVVIEAVGDADVLASGLEIINFSLEFHRNFFVEVEKKENITLPPYRG
ncbi:MAG: DUF881 domain-containing protein [Firmicutes bacterium]|nr:DUF881 domain-containing protein [Bacillota bacterium]